MKLEYSEVENGIRLIKLIGRLDLGGTNIVEPQFALYCEGEKVFMLVDLSEVTYLSSIGIPMLINHAKAIEKRGGKLALVKPLSNVKYILDLTGVSHMIRIYNSLDTAIERVMSD